jgi:uncharacterized protein YkwD
MRHHVRTRSRLRAPAKSALAWILGLVLGGVLAGGATATSDATFSPDPAAAELVRLLNGERTANGLPELMVDPFLQWVARDGPVDCPDGTGTMEGRSKDMALSGYFSHSLRLCPTYDIGDAVYAWGYHSYSGEIVSWNGGYDYSSFPYQFGCDVREENCTGATTSAPTTVAMSAHGFMDSQGHRDNVLSIHFDRFACGAWESSAPDNYHYYTCIFADGPGTAVAPDPLPAPSLPEPSPTPTPTPVVDETAPSLTGLTAPSIVTSANRSFVASWTATDDLTLADYVVWIRKGNGAWSTGTIQSAASKTFSGLAPGTWHVRVQARDAAGNRSNFRETAVIVPRDDRAWAFSSGTTRRTGGNFVKGTATTTYRAGARMTIKFSGASFVLIGTSAVKHGRMRVVIDGRAYVVDEGYYKGSRAKSTHNRVILLSKTLTNKAHTVVITCLGTSGRPTIDIDAVAWRS